MSFSDSNKHVVTCRAIWRVKKDDVLLAEKLITSKRLILDEEVSKVKGVEFFFSSVGGVTTNATRKAKQPSASQRNTLNVNEDNEGNPATEEVDKAEKEKETATVDVNKEDIVFPSVSYFVICKNGCAETENRIHKSLHKAQTEVETRVLKSKKKDQDHEKELLSTLCQVLKDHNSSYAKVRLKDSVDFCYNQTIMHNLEGASESEKPRLFPFLTPHA